MALVPALMSRIWPHARVPPSVVPADAEINEGDTSEEGLMARIKAAAADGIYFTVVGE